MLGERYQFRIALSVRPVAAAHTTLSRTRYPSFMSAAVLKLANQKLWIFS